MEFKVGDKVEKLNGETFSNREKIATIEEIRGSLVWLSTGYRLESGKLILARSRQPKSPIQEEVVTKRKLVRGIYGIVMVQESTAETPKDHIAIRIDRSIRGASAEELEEASHILAQLAEFLRSEGK